jgi:xylulokinase
MAHRFLNAGAPATGPLVLAVDLGTSGCKCALIAFDGTVAAWAFEPVPLYIDGVTAEQDPADWWNAFLISASAVLWDSALRSRVTTVCCSTMGESTVCVDREGNAIGRAMLWLDMRGREAIGRRVGRSILKVQGYSPWRLWRWLRLTGGVPSVTGKDCAGHIAFIRDHEPDRYDRTYKFLNVLDYMNLRLTGRFCTTPEAMLSTWVTDNRDPFDIRYHSELIGMLGLDRDKLPEIVASTEVLGPLLPDVASALGLGKDTVAVAGATDASAVAVGAAPADFAPHLYLGTSAWLGAHVPFMKTNVVSGMASIPCAVQGRYLAIALQSTAGANLQFLRDRIIYHAQPLLPEEQRPYVYEILTEVAARVPAGANGLIYLPWLFGERSPTDDASLRACLFNLSLGHTREDIVRAMMEGVALNTRWTMEPFLRLLGRSMETITAAGGGAQSDLWCQIVADVTGRPVRQLASPLQANAIGATFIAGVGTGALRWADLPALQRTRRLYEPDASLKTLFDDKYEVFKDLHRKLAPVYRRLNPPAGEGTISARPGLQPATG